MPKYRYMCSECTTIITVFHRINETLVDCSECESVQSMEKLLSTPIIIKDEVITKNNKVGELTKEYIEANREILEQQKKEAKKEDYEPS